MLFDTIQCPEKLSVLHRQQSLASADVSLLTPCSSSFSRVSRTLGEFEAKRRQCRFSSGMMNSSSLLGDKPLGVVWRAAEGTDSSKMEPRSVFIWGEGSHSAHPIRSILHTLNPWIELRGEEKSAALPLWCERWFCNCTELRWSLLSPLDGNWWPLDRGGRPCRRNSDVL